MKTLGILGGMSPASTSIYYQNINQYIQEALGGNHSAPILLDSLNFEPIVQLQQKGEWDVMGKELASHAQKLQQAGAEILILATNTMHKVASYIEENIQIPFLNIIDVTADAILASGINNIALLGTKFTMQDSFYRERLEKHGLCVLTPTANLQDTIHQHIFTELCLNKVTTNCRKTFGQAIQQLKDEGAQGVILGCTEICLAVDEENSCLPIFDSTTLHCQAAAKAVLQKI